MLLGTWPYRPSWHGPDGHMAISVLDPIMAYSPMAQKDLKRVILTLPVVEMGHSGPFGPFWPIWPDLAYLAIYGLLAIGSKGPP